MPAYVISWTKENDRLPMSRATDSDGVLNIRDVQITDSGAYVCTGSNMYNTDRATAHLKVIPGLIFVGLFPGSIILIQIQIDKMLILRLYFQFEIISDIQWLNAIPFWHFP